jgi:GT2 family glycosyltransferase
MALDSAVRALRDAMERRGIDAEVRLLPISCYRISYKVEGRPLISIIIPIGSLKFVKDCVTSLIEKTNYNNCEIIILDNRTRADISKILPDDERLRIIPYDFEYNFSRMNNFASKVARGEYLLFLNDDTKVISAEWLSVMLEHAQREEVGAVGAKLLYANGTVQHAGIIIGVYGYAVNYGPGLNLESSDPGSFGLAAVIRNCSAVTAACMMVRKSVFTELGGFDETLGHSWNDVDFGIRILESGRRIVYTPYAELYHYEGGTRGQFDVSVNEIAARERFKKKHLDFISRGDPYYNPNLSLVHPYQISRANKRR